jgi:hypothetical protein
VLVIGLLMPLLGILIVICTPLKAAGAQDAE